MKEKARGIDVSKWQGKIDWKEVKSSGVDFAILRAGVGSDYQIQDDGAFAYNAQECTRLGIPFGAYLYSYADSVKKAESEARHILRVIKGYRLAYPIYYDLEDAGTVGKCSNRAIAGIARAFCDITEGEGYFTGIYANRYWFSTRLTDPVFDRWVRWVAEYAKRTSYTGKYGMWQYSSGGKVPGIRGNVDMNICYEDYPSIIKKAGLNGF